MAKETPIPIDCSGKVDAIFKTIEDYPASKQLVLGTVSGWCTGVIATKIGKAVAICVGGGIIFIQVANQQGYIKFNWDKIQKSIDKASDKVEEVATGKGPSTLDKMERFLDRKLDKAEEKLRVGEKKARRWYHKMTGADDPRIRNVEVFMFSFAAGIALGLLVK